MVRGTSVEVAGSLQSPLMKVSANPRLLLIERQSLFTPFLVRVFEEAGASVSLAGHRPAIARLVRLDPDVVCVELDYLEVAPFVALRKLRDLLPQTRIVALTAVSDSLWLALAHCAGANAVLGPGAQVSDLLEALDRP
ncbi:MAG TPA: hypothetical protein VKG44_01550 [Candidatus Baltobacteraceae bacterium]|nr:hypothetical protein [Candidatus Baltobacteraceae bacterium]